MNCVDRSLIFIIDLLINLVSVSLYQDFNPYTSHLIDTGSQCSSRTGPYCKFINKKEIMPVHITMTPTDKSVHQILIASA